MNAAALPTTPLRGRPRDPRRDAAIVGAALELVAELGYQRASIDAIAARAGVSKPTIYRRWAAKDELVIHALRSRKAEGSGSWDTGSLRGDLLAAAREIVGAMVDECRLAAGLATAMRESAELAQLVREHVVEDDRRRYMEIAERAVARGEIAADPPVTRLFPDVAPSLVFTRMLVTRDPVDDRFVEELVDRVLIPILAVSGA